MASRPAVVLLSGGLDSATALAVADVEGFETFALSFRYGQRHETELAAAVQLAQAARVGQHVVADIDLRTFGGSALTSNIPVPKDRPVEAMSAKIPVTYVPARNTIFLSYALAWAEVLGSTDIFMGVNAVDYSGYPDCRPEYIAAFQQMANLATRAGVEGGRGLIVHTPLIHMGKADIIRRGIELGVDYSVTRSCYALSAKGISCGRCDSCLLRLKGFAEVGIADPIPYMAGSAVAADVRPAIEV